MPTDDEQDQDPQGGREGARLLHLLPKDLGIVTEKYRASERGIAPIRFLVALFTGSMFFFAPGPDPIHWLAITVILVAIAYSAWVVFARPYEDHEFLASSTFVSAADATLITLFLVATGGFASPYFPLWYVSAIALSLRFGVLETLVGVTLYTVLYGFVTASMNGLAANLARFVVRSGYIYLAATLGLMASMLVQQEMVERRNYQRLSRRLKETASSLREALSIQEATFDATADGLLVVDEDQNVVASNKRFREIWDLPEDLPEDNEVLIDAVLDQLENPQRFLERTRELHEHPAEEGFDEVRFKDGRILERYSRPQRLGGEIIGRVWSFRDVTEEREARQELQEANEELRRYAKAAGRELEFARAAAHDLKEPARMVAGYLELVRQRHGSDLDEEAREMLGYAERGAHRLETLVSGLARYSRLETAEADKEAIDSGRVLDDVLTSLSMRIEEKNASIHRGQLPVVHADEAQLGQVFQNLITNAIKFSKPDVPPRIQISATREGDMWRFDVEDNGIGMDPDNVDDLFQIFRQADAGESKGGQGIGLAICKKIVNHHGGRIDVDTTPGEGTTFSFTLPAPGSEHGSSAESRSQTTGPAAQA